jgi:hypothetical protein
LPALSNISSGVFLLNVAGVGAERGAGSPVKHLSSDGGQGNNKTFAVALRRGAAELNSTCEAGEGVALVLAFAPYAHSDHWRKTWTARSFGLGASRYDRTAQHSTGAVNAAHVEFRVGTRHTYQGLLFYERVVVFAPGQRAPSLSCSYLSLRY